MLALWFDQVLALRSDLPTPRPGADQALIRVSCAAVCRTDIEIIHGYKGFTGVLGHEFVGVVEECAEAALIGKRVCGEINVSCGACALCRSGMREHCARRHVVGIKGWDGAFAEYLVLPVQNLHLIPDGMEDEVAVFVEPVAAACEIVRQVRFDASTRVVVLGDGKLGILCAQVVAHTGAHVVLRGRHSSKGQSAHEVGVQWSDARTAEDLHADVVIEATGSPLGLQEAIELVEPRGTIVLKSTTAALAEIDLSPVVVKEISVIGSRCGPFAEAIGMLRNGSVRVLPLISGRYPLTDATTAVRHAEQPGSLKILIDVPRA